jgi:methionyl-tRNA formyltransferase
MTSSLTLVFCGTPAFAVPTLQKLADKGFQIPLVVTQPDKPRGRGLELAPTPVKQRAMELRIPVTQPTSIRNNEELRTQLAAIHPDAIIIVGYGRIIPQWMIELPRLGNLNVHASLLPKYRGAAPIQWAIASGESITGVTTMRIDAGLDTGDILLQRELAIDEEDTSVSLAPRLAEIGADLMVETFRSLEANRIRPRQQEEAQATLAPILKREDGLIDFNRPASEIYNRLRGFQPWPGAYTTFRAKNFQIHWAKPGRLGASLPCGELRVEKDDVFVGCGSGTVLQLVEVQLEGKKRMPAADLVRGYRPSAGEHLG